MPYTAAELERSRHPFEILFIAVIILTAIGGLTNRQVRPGSIQEGVGTGGTYVWYAALLVGGLLALVGILWRERATGLVLEALGLFTSGICTIFYAAVAVILIGGNSAFSAGLLTGYGVAAVWRAAQIRRKLAKVAEEHSTEHEE